MINLVVIEIQLDDGGELGNGADVLDEVLAEREVDDLLQHQQLVRHATLYASVGQLHVLGGGRGEGVCV